MNGAALLWKHFNDIVFVAACLLFVIVMGVLVWPALDAFTTTISVIFLATMIAMFVRGISE